MPSKGTPSPTKPSPPPLETLPSKKSCGTDSGTNSKSPPRQVQKHYPVKHSPAEKRLDKVIYGLDEMHITPTDRSKQLRKSQSNDRLNEMEIIPTPNPVAEPPRLMPQRRAIKSVTRAKPRPLSMVLPDHVQVFAPHPPEYFAAPPVWTPGPPPPPHHPMISHFNHSFVNLHAPPTHVHLPDPYGPPPPYHGGYGMQRKAWNPYEGYPV